MNRLPIALVSAVAATAAFLPGAASAAPKPSAEILGTVVTRDGGADVRARYTCTEDTHLWVSVKQAADATRDAALEGEGSSALAANMADAHPFGEDGLNCDGRSHVQTFHVDTRPDKGDLVKGDAWVQFCMTSENFFVYPTRWAQVR